MSRLGTLFGSILFFMNSAISIHPSEAQPFAPAGAKITGAVQALAFRGTDVFVGGAFTNGAQLDAIDYIGRWDSVEKHWHPLGKGLDGPVRSIAINGTEVFVGGSFTNAFNTDGPVVVNNVAKFDLATGRWSAFTVTIAGQGANGILGTINSVVPDRASSGGDLFVGGVLKGIPGITGQHFIARWSQSTKSWSLVGTGGPETTVSDMAYSPDGATLFVAAGWLIKRWNGSSWSTVAYPSGSNVSAVSRLLPTATGFYAAGTMYLKVGQDLHGQDIVALNIARWDGANWYRVGDPLMQLHQWSTQPIYSLAIQGTRLFAGGDFEPSNPASLRKGIGKFDLPDGSWTAVETGLLAPDTTFGSRGPLVLGTSPNGVLYAGGLFADAGGNVDADYLAFLNSEDKWVALLDAGPPLPAATPTTTPTPAGTAAPTPTVPAGMVMWRGTVEEVIDQSRFIRAPLAGATITIRYGSTIVGSSVSDAQGAWRINFAVPADYTGGTCFASAAKFGYTSGGEYGILCTYSFVNSYDGFDFIMSKAPTPVPTATPRPSAPPAPTLVPPTLVPPQGSPGVEAAPLSVRAFAAKGKAGKKVKLRFGTFGAENTVRRTVVIRSGKRVVKTLRGRINLGVGMTSASTFVPFGTRAMRSGRYAWCVTIADELGRKSNTSCASLRLS